jgi:hypothetical protein
MDKFLNIFELYIRNRMCLNTADILLLLRWGESVSLWNWASNGPFVHLPDDIWLDVEQRWNDTDRGKQKDSEKTCPSATLSTTNRTWTNLGSSPGREADD